MMVAILSCGKSTFEITDPETGEPPVPMTSDSGQCHLIKIMQRNKSKTQNDNVFLMERNASFVTSRISYYDSLTGKMDFTVTTSYSGDTIILNTGEYLVTDKTTGYVRFLYTRSDFSDPGSDEHLYEYIYNAAGYLSRKLVYINGSGAPAYQTNYNYENGLLTDCVLYTGAQKNKFLESTIQYDAAMPIKPWLYLFPDFFEGYYYAQSFSFGRKQSVAAKSIVTKIYDPSTTTLLDTWATTLSGYVLSKDNFVLQVDAKGDHQQGLGLLFGTTRFEYSCSK
jgi:hypothetical protein